MASMDLDDLTVSSSMQIMTEGFCFQGSGSHIHMILESKFGIQVPESAGMR